VFYDQQLIHVSVPCGFLPWRSGSQNQEGPHEGRFWTRLQAAFYRTILDGSIKFCAHRRLTLAGLAKATGASKAEITDHLSYMPGLLDSLTWSHHFIPERAMIFFAALWIP